MFQWQDAVAALHKFSRNPALLDKDGNGVADARGQDAYPPGSVRRMTPTAWAWSKRFNAMRPANLWC